MNIQSVKLHSPNYNSTVITQQILVNPSYMSINNSDIFVKERQVPSFTGFNKTLIEVAKNNCFNEAALTKSFGTLFNELVADHTIPKSREFNLIAYLYEKNGFYGLLRELWKAKPIKDVEVLLSKAEEDALTLAGTEENPAFLLSNIGRHGFFNSIFDNKNAPRNVELSFLHGGQCGEYAGMTFSLGEKGNFEMSHHSGRPYYINSYFLETGTLRKRVTDSKEAEYFNKDGTKNSIKTFFLGDPPVVYP